MIYRGEPSNEAVIITTGPSFGMLPATLFRVPMVARKPCIGPLAQISQFDYAPHGARTFPGSL